MFTLFTRAAQLLLDCPPDTLRCALFASDPGWSRKQSDILFSRDGWNRLLLNSIFTSVRYDASGKDGKDSHNPWFTNRILVRLFTYIGTTT